MTQTLRGMASPAPEVGSRAIGLGRVLKIAHSCFTARVGQAFHAMTHLAAIPTVRDHGQLCTFGNEVALPERYLYAVR